MVSCTLLLSFSWSSLLILLLTQTKPFSKRGNSFSLLLCILLLETQAISKRWKFSEKYRSLSWYIIKRPTVTNASRGKTNLKPTQFYCHNIRFPFLSSTWCTGASAPLTSLPRAQPCSLSCWGQTFALDEAPLKEMIQDTGDWGGSWASNDGTGAPDCPALGGFVSLKFCTQSDQCSRGKYKTKQKNAQNFPNFLIWFPRGQCFTFCSTTATNMLWQKKWNHKIKWASVSSQRKPGLISYICRYIDNSCLIVQLSYVLLDFTLFLRFLLIKLLITRTKI